MSRAEMLTPRTSPSAEIAGLVETESSYLVPSELRQTHGASSSALGPGPMLVQRRKPSHGGGTGGGWPITSRALQPSTCSAPCVQRETLPSTSTSKATRKRPCSAAARGAREA